MDNGLTGILFDKERAVADGIKKRLEPWHLRESFLTRSKGGSKPRILIGLQMGNYYMLTYFFNDAACQDSSDYSFRIVPLNLK
jgi:hypothetical protein